MVDNPCSYSHLENKIDLDKYYNLLLHLVIEKALIVDKKHIKAFLIVNLSDNHATIYSKLLLKIAK